MILIRDQIHEDEMQETKNPQKEHKIKEKQKQSCDEIKKIQDLMTIVNQVKKLKKKSTKLEFLKQQLSIDESSFKASTDQELNQLINDLRKKFYNSDEEEQNSL